MTCLNNCCAFIQINVAVAVNIIHLKCPFELVLLAGSRGDTKSTHELSEVQQLISVLVETSEDVVGELKIKFNCFP